MKYFYAREKLFQAVEVLAVGRKSKKEQLVDAAQILHVLKEKDIPSEVLSDWRFYIENIANKSAPKNYDVNNFKGNIYWTVQQMHWSKMLKIRQAIVNMFQAVI